MAEPCPIGRDDVMSVKMEVMRADVLEMKLAIQKMADALTKMALIEERLSQNATSLGRAFVHIEKIDARLSRLEVLSPAATETQKWVERGIIALCSGAVMFVAKTAGML